MANEDRGYVFRARLDGTALASQLTTLFGEDALAIVTSVETAEFVTFVPGDAAAFVQRWTGARVFDRSAELRWRKSETEYLVLMLTEKNEPPEHFQQLDKSEFLVRDPSSDEGHGFLLWGTTRVKDGWLETRIPRRLNYPLRSEKKLRLAYRLYQDHGTVRWVRLNGLKEIGNA